MYTRYMCRSVLSRPSVVLRRFCCVVVFCARRDYKFILSGATRRRDRVFDDLE